MEFDDLIVGSEIEIELYDENNEGVSYKNEPLHLEHGITLDDDAIIVLVKDEVENDNCYESTEIVEKSEPPRRLDYSFIKEYFTIEKLTPEEAKKEVLLRKESNNYKTSPYKCNLCYRGFATLQSYENHIKKHNKHRGEYMCNFCYMRFSTTHYLRNHKVKCHTSKYICKSCPYTCFRFTQVPLHIEVHKGNTHPCNESGQVYNNVCEEGGETFEREDELRKHPKLHKLTTKKSISRSMGEKDGLRAVLRTDPSQAIANGTWVPTKCMQYICDLCGDTVVGRRNYRAHVRNVHLTVLPREAFNDSGKVHYVCEVCGKMYKSQALLMYHQMVHTGERPYSCSECGKTFKAPFDLKNHYQSHSASRHKCEFCDKTFAYQTSLVRHTKRHLGILPYKCDICGRRFTSPSEVKYHTQYVHLKTVPWPKRDRSKRKNARTSHSVPS